MDASIPVSSRTPIGLRRNRRGGALAAAMLFGMVMQDSGFKLLVVSNASMPEHLIEMRARRAVQIFLRGVRKGA